MTGGSQDGVDDAVEVVGTDGRQVGERRVGDRVGVGGEQVGRRPRTGPTSSEDCPKPVALSAYGQAGPVGVALARPHLLGAGDVGDVVVLDAQRVPDQPADRVGLGDRAATEGVVVDVGEHPVAQRRGSARRRR